MYPHINSSKRTPLLVSTFLTDDEFSLFVLSFGVRSLPGVFFGVFLDFLALEGVSGLAGVRGADFCGTDPCFA